MKKNWGYGVIKANAHAATLLNIVYGIEFSREEYKRGKRERRRDGGRQIGRE